jgi:hypothetical protein
MLLISPLHHPRCDRQTQELFLGLQRTHRLCPNNLLANDRFGEDYMVKDTGLSVGGASDSYAITPPSLPQHHHGNYK